MLLTFYALPRLPLANTAVLTNTAPLWIGLPVQWCGLVYGDAIRGFARHDPSGPWIELAKEAYQFVKGGER